MKRALLLILTLAAAVSLSACSLSIGPRSCCKHEQMQGKKQGCKKHSGEGHQGHGSSATKEGSPVKLLPAAEPLVQPADAHAGHGGH